MTLARKNPGGTASTSLPNWIGWRKLPRPLVGWITCCTVRENGRWIGIWTDWQREGKPLGPAFSGSMGRQILRDLFRRTPLRIRTNRVGRTQRGGGSVSDVSQAARIAAKQRSSRDFRVLGRPTCCAGDRGSAGPVGILDCFGLPLPVDVTGQRKSMRKVETPNMRAVEERAPLFGPSLRCIQMGYPWKDGIMECRAVDGS